MQMYLIENKILVPISITKMLQMDIKIKKLTNSKLGSNIAKMFITMAGHSQEWIEQRGTVQEHMQHVM